MEFNSKFWLRFSLVNLLIVALLGLVMRYKIGFEFPVFQQKHLQFSHYHFAFYGWIGQTIMVLMVHCISRINPGFSSKRYIGLFSLNLISSYGMLISFIISGFNPLSVFFLISAILSSYWFTVYYLKDLRRHQINRIAANWFRSALLFNFMSTLGVFYLAYLMLGPHMHQNEYLATSYYFLHFQYNGWFFFACMGFFISHIDGTAPVHRAVFRWFFVACIPAYFLSVLWLDIPRWLFVIVALSAIAQVYAWILQLMAIIKTKPGSITQLPFVMRYLLLFIGVACTIKVMLQLGSTIPEISKLAFGFRPIVIAYLHLVLLAIITLFLLFYIFANRLLADNKYIMICLILFSSGVMLNEVILAIQGVAAFSYTVIPLVNEMLFTVSVLMAGSIGVLAVLAIIPEKYSEYDINHNLTR